MAAMIGFGCLSLFLLIGFAIWIKRSLEESIEKRFSEASGKVIHENLQSILALAGNTFEEKVKHVQSALLGNEKSVHALVSEIQSQVKTYQQEIKATEQDRAVKFSEILTVASRLNTSTEKLNKILNTNSLRGQWGERIADDILRTSGLLEGTHYLKNKQLDTSLNRPDFTFFLPDEHKINMDVKFPIANLAKAQETEEPSEQKRYLKEFEYDVKNRIQEIAKKDYINPDESTVDFAILFVPNESVYAVIHTSSPALISFAEERKVILAAPFTLIAILKVILQSFRHFYYEKRIRDIVALIEKLGDDLTRFKERFIGFDDQVRKLKKLYDEIADTSFKSIQSKITKIEQYKLGSDQKEGSTSEAEVHEATEVESV